MTTNNENSHTRIYKKHFIIYNNGGVISATTPKDWARANKNLFPNFDFSNSDNTPIVSKIEDYLSKNNFTKIENNEVVIHYDFLSL